MGKMNESDIDSLEEITGNDNVYKYIPAFLYKKSRGNLLAAIRNIGGRDFDKKKMIIAGIYLKDNSEHLVGLTEMFDYKKKINQITIGYRLNEGYWHKGIATSAVALMKEYLIETEQIGTLYAYVMPENIFSAKVLEKNGFIKQPNQKEESGWGGREHVLLDVFTYSKL